MKANELRIGNLFWWTEGGNKLISRVTNQFIERRASVVPDGIDIPFCEDIKITPEILLQSGFEFDDVSRVYKKDGINIQVKDDGFMLVEDGIQISNVFYFVHHLQNLVFDLKKTEMEIVVVKSWKIYLKRSA